MTSAVARVANNRDQSYLGGLVHDRAYLSSKNFPKLRRSFDIVGIIGNTTLYSTDIDIQFRPVVWHLSPSLSLPRLPSPRFYNIQMNPKNTVFEFINNALPHIIPTLVNQILEC